MSAALELTSVTKLFGGLSAVKDLDMRVDWGEIHALIGPNGSGKSTTLNLISGLYIPTSGTVAMGGKDISKVPAAARTIMGVARTFQNIRLFRRMSVLENVMLSRYCRTKAGLLQVLLRLPRERTEERSARDRAMEALAMVAMERRADALPGDLPYGEQRLIEIARALATDPQLILLDEPAAGMTPTEKVSLMQLIRRLNTALGLTVLLVEHDMNLVMNVCGRVTVLNFGARIADGTVAEVRSNPEVVQAYLGADEDAPLTAERG